MKAVDMFSKYKEMCQELSMVAYEISHFTGLSQEDIIEVMTFIRYNSETGRYLNSSKRTETIAILSKEIMERENDKWYKYLFDRYQYLDEEIGFFEFCIRQMGEKKSEILFEVLDGGLTWDQIADQYAVSRSLIGVYRKDAIKELERLYGIREKHREEYREKYLK